MNVSSHSSLYNRYFLLITTFFLSPESLYFLPQPNALTIVLNLTATVIQKTLQRLKDLYITKLISS